MRQWDQYFASDEIDSSPCCCGPCLGGSWPSPANLASSSSSLWILERLQRTTSHCHGLDDGRMDSSVAMHWWQWPVRVNHHKAFNSSAHYNCHFNRFPGDRYIRSPSDKDLVLIFDGNGFIAGAQMFVPETSALNDQYFPFSTSEWYQAGELEGEAVRDHFLAYITLYLRQYIF